MHLPKMVLINAGMFEMGSNQIQDTSIQPAKMVSLNKFSISETEVSIGLWKLCIRDKACKKIGTINEFKNALPITSVSWNEVQQSFIPWLRNKTNINFRLPSETEWEYVAREGKPLAYTSIYDFKSKVDKSSFNCSNNYCTDKYDALAPTKTLEPNTWGIYNMQGNVWEWTQDCWVENYDNTSTTNDAVVTNACNSITIRGGSWRDPIENLLPVIRTNFEKMAIQMI